MNTSCARMTSKTTAIAPDWPSQRDVAERSGSRCTVRRLPKKNTFANHLSILTRYESGMANPQPTFVERRNDGRGPVRAPARVMHGAALAHWADCIIRDLSVNGAKIELSHFYKLPPRFVLLHFQAGVGFEVVLKWRRGDLAGMSFEQRHELLTASAPHLEPVRAAWLALQTGFRAE